MKKSWRFSRQDRDIAQSKFGWKLDDMGYVRGRTMLKKRKRYFRAHRLVLSRILGRSLTPKDICDHRNGVRTDNRRSNLRLVTRSQNLQNQKVRGIFRGTTKIKRLKKWMAQVGYHGQRFYLGVFTSRKTAARVAKLKRQELGFLT